MLNELAIGLFCTLLGLCAGQAAFSLAFAYTLSRFRQKLLSDADCPKAAAILCLRGTDPFLTKCVEALLDQDYPRYDVKVIVDDRHDPAWRVVEETAERHGATNISVEPLTERRDTCSLKCSSVVQGISSLDESYEIVALLDADTIPHRTWLRELATALDDDGVGAATGNRWYMPVEPTWGSLVRLIWNAAAVVQMWFYRIAWGGTFAIKTKVFRESDLLERWGNAFCEDTMTFAALKKLSLSVKFVPTLMMVNRETCDLGGFFRWVRRQLLTARLYHPGWIAVAVHGIVTSLAPALALVLLTYALVFREWTAAIWTGAGLALYELGLLLLLPPVDAAIRRIVRSRGETPQPVSVLSWPLYALALPLTQIVYMLVLLSSLTVRRVDWRGVSYRIDGPFRIKLIEYRPYTAEKPAEDALASL